MSITPFVLHVYEALLIFLKVLREVGVDTCNMRLFTIVNGTFSLAAASRRTGGNDA